MKLPEEVKPMLLTAPGLFIYSAGVLEVIPLHVIPVHVRAFSVVAPTTFKVPPELMFPVELIEPKKLESPVIEAPPADTDRVLVALSVPVTTLLPVIDAPRLVTFKPPVTVAPPVAIRIHAETLPVTSIDPVMFTPVVVT